MFSAAKEPLCCDVTKKFLSSSLFIPSTHASKHLLSTQHHSGQKGEPTHMHKHSDAHAVMRDNSGFKDSLMTTGM